MSMHEEQSNIEVGIMVNNETGERRVSINLPGEAIILLDAEQADAVINSLNEAVADITAEPYMVVGTIQ